MVWHCSFCRSDRVLLLTSSLIISLASGSSPLSTSYMPFFISTFFVISYGNTCSRLRKIDSKKLPACPKFGRATGGSWLCCGGVRSGGGWGAERRGGGGGTGRVGVTSMPWRSVAPWANGQSVSFRQYPFIQYWMNVSVPYTVGFCRWRLVLAEAEGWREGDLHAV